MSDLWNVRSMKCLIYKMSDLWNVQSMTMSDLWNVRSVTMSDLWNVQSMKCPIYEISNLCLIYEKSYVWNVQSMKCPIYENARSLKSPMYEMSDLECRPIYKMFSLQNVLFMKCPLFKMSNSRKVRFMKCSMCDIFCMKCLNTNNKNFDGLFLGQTGGGVGNKVPPSLSFYLKAPSVFKVSYTAWSISHELIRTQRQTKSRYFIFIIFSQSVNV